jgi:hypothetical protein
MRPLQPCTSVFAATTGLPCAHQVDYIRKEGLSLLPSDFHPHWYWDRYSGLPELLLEPLRVITYLPSTSRRTHSTRRIPSGWEGSEPQLRRCGLCREIGHTRASLECPVNIRHAREVLRAESATQIPSDLEHSDLEHSDLEHSDSGHSNSASQFIPRATIQAFFDSAGQSRLKLALQSILDSGDQLILKSTIQSVLESTIQPSPESTVQPIPEPASPPIPRSLVRFSLSPDPEFATQPGPRLLLLSPSPEPATYIDPIPADSHPIWPGRPELIHKRYIAEKAAWLIAHPDVQPAEYRKVRGLEYYPKRWLNENRKYLGIQRLDLETETLLDYIEHPPKWTDEEVEAWLDWDAEETIEVERQVQAEFDTRGGFSAERGVQGLNRQIRRDIQARRNEYRFA